MTVAPYFDDGQVTLYLSDCREMLPRLDLAHVGVVVADPPYGETSLEWDRWPTGWVATLAESVRRSCSLWCFGSMRMFLDRRDEFAGWQFAQDIVWRKPNGTGFVADRFRRVHEHATQWYRGPWNLIYHETPRVHVGIRHMGTVTQGRNANYHLGAISQGAWTDDGTRLMPSVIEVRNMWHSGAIHPTQKPLGILEPLLRYSLSPGGCVLDPFAGSCSTLVAAREAGYRAIGIEADPEMCEKAAQRLAQGALPFAPQEAHRG